MKVKTHEINLRGFCYCFFIVIVLPREKDARAFSLPELEYNLSLLFDMSESEIVQVDKQYVNCYCVVYQLYCMLTYAHYSAMYWPHLNSFFYILYTSERQPESICVIPLYNTFVDTTTIALNLTLPQ